MPATNSILEPTIIAKEALMQFKNRAVLANLINKDYSEQFAHVGERINVRRPVIGKTQRNNLDLTAFDASITEGSVPVRLNKTVSAMLEYSSLEMTLTIEDYSRLHLQPQIQKMVEDIEMDIAAQYRSVPHAMGAVGTPFNTFTQFATAAASMTERAVPMDERRAVFTPTGIVPIVGEVKNVFSQNRVEKALGKGQVGEYAFVDTYTSAHMLRHTAGSQGGTPLVNGGSQGTTYEATKDTNWQLIAIDGLPPSITGVLKAGDVIRFAGCNDVNPITKQDLGVLKTYTVLEDANSNGTGQVNTLKISPPIIASGTYQNVTAVPADNAAITYVTTGTSNQALFFHRDAFTLVTRPLAKLEGGVENSSVASGNGMSISVMKFITGMTRKQYIRLDMLYSVEPINPHLALRYIS